MAQGPGDEESVSEGSIAVQKPSKWAGGIVGHAATSVPSEVQVEGSRSTIGKAPNFSLEEAGLAALRKYIQTLLDRNNDLLSHRSRK